ncbi:MAG: hypothetical protein P8J50_19180 [Acidimicrobiales bacterium]|nr:hypothetical protein [Acidimicrobiales bacterium]
MGAGAISGTAASSDVGPGGIAFAQAAWPWWILAGLLIVARAIAMSAFWRLATGD